MHLKDRTKFLFVWKTILSYSCMLFTEFFELSTVDFAFIKSFFKQQQQWNFLHMISHAFIVENFIMAFHSRNLRVRLEKLGVALSE